MTWKVVSYVDETIPLIESDLVRFKDESEKSETIESESADKIEKLAVVLEFSLPSSSYATMALREAMKSGTSVAFQKFIAKK